MLILTTYTSAATTTKTSIIKYSNGPIEEFLQAQQATSQGACHTKGVYCSRTCSRYLVVSKWCGTYTFYIFYTSSLASLLTETVTQSVYQFAVLPTNVTHCEWCEDDNIRLYLVPTGTRYICCHKFYINCIFFIFVHSNNQYASENYSSRGRRCCPVLIVVRGGRGIYGLILGSNYQ